MDMNDHAFIQNGQYIQVLKAHIVINLDNMGGVDKKDIILPKGLEYIKM